MIGPWCSVDLRGGGALHPAFFQPLFFTLPFCPLLEIRSTLLHSLGHYLQYFLREPVFQAEARFSKKFIRLCAPPRFLFCSWCVLARRGLWLVFLMSLGFRCRKFFLFSVRFAGGVARSENRQQKKVVQFPVGVPGLLLMTSIRSLLDCFIFFGSLVF